MVAGGYNDVSLRVSILYSPADVCYAWCRVTAARLAEDVPKGYLRQLLVDDGSIAVVGYYPYVLRSAYALEAVVCELEQGASHTEDVDELLWVLGSAHRPKATADASCHNN